MAAAPVASERAKPSSRGCCGAADPNDKYGMLPARSRKFRDCIGCILFLAFGACFIRVFPVAMRPLVVRGR
jgi:hypothetical protein